MTERVPPPPFQGTAEEYGERLKRAALLVKQEREAALTQFRADELH